jgi:hypothetical protein
MRPSLTLLARLSTLALVVTTTACGSDDDGADGSGGSAGTVGNTGAVGNTGGSGNAGGRGSPGANDNCGLEITLTGDVMLDLSIDTGITCLTAYTTAPGAYVGFGPVPVEDVALVALSFPELDPGQTATALEIPMTIHHVDRTQFPLSCAVDITENSFHETTAGGDVYRVAGEGSCSEAGTSGDRSVSVDAGFRFFAPIRWQD